MKSIYQIHEKLGQGGMGEVYRATHRLTRRDVALKRVFLESDNETLRTALANEYKTLATLHHPHIVQTLSYGFDSELGAYFTMDLLPAPKTIVEEGNEHDTQGKIHLLIQLLRALSYIHQRGIIHRDLKPSNVLCVGLDVKVVDFGVALGRNDRSTVAGTLLYMAPELFNEIAASSASDLYAVGVIAYEMFAHKFPFVLTDSDQLQKEKLDSSVYDTLPLQNPNLPSDGLPITSELDDVTEKTESGPMFRAIDFSPLPMEVRPVIERLLQPDPSFRYALAADVIVALGFASETIETRESHLQAADLVGRTAELQQLFSSLADTRHGQGTGWLLAGESGVGKSRLLEELRTRAYVGGAHVAQGQAIVAGGTAYHVWLPILRALCIYSDVNDDDLAVIKEIVPDLPELVEHPIPDAIRLTGPVAQARFIRSAISLIHQQTAPVLILLEDLQWSDADGLMLLQHVAASIEGKPILLIGTFRSDESPDLSQRLSTMKTLHLSRLGRSAIEQLAMSILGSAGQDSDIVNYLQRETEGNAFFVVEILRALAEQAGDLASVRRVQLHERLMTGGIESCVDRRLKRISPESIAVLEACAVIGREVDDALVRRLHPEVDLERWRIECANASVLNYDAGAWRFSHDKLRERLMAAMPAPVRKAKHAQIGGAIEDVYASRLEAKSAALAHQFREANIFDKASGYAIAAGDNAAKVNALTEAREHYKRALESLDRVSESEPRNRMTVHALLNLVEVAIWTESPAVNRARLERAEAIAGESARSAYWRGRCETGRGAFRSAIEQYEKAIARAQESHADDVSLPAKGYIGHAFTMLGEFGKSRPYLSEATAGLQACGNWVDWIRIAATYAYVSSASGEFGQHMTLFERAFDLAERINHPAVLGSCFNLLGMCHVARGDWHQAAEALRRAFAIADRKNERIVAYIAATQIMIPLIRLGDIAEATTFRKKGEAIAAQFPGTTLYFFDFFEAISVELFARAGEVARALEYAPRAVATNRATDNLVALGYAERAWGMALSTIGERAESDAHFSEALALFERGGVLTDAAFTRLWWGQRAQVEEALGRFEAWGMKQLAAEARALLSAHTSSSQPYRLGS
jgi:tetratricopeptide (TPR) repeat protein